MTRGGDDGEFQTHPGDPWHPGWSDDAEAREPKVGKPPQAESPKKRRFLGRKRRERDEAVDESSPADEDVAVVVAPIGDDTLFRPAEQPEPEASEPPTVSRRPAAEPPMPAWLSDPPQLERDVALTVELPSWVGKTTAGAEGVAAGFEEPTDSAAAVPGASPGGDDLAAALSALGALDDADVEVAVGESLETDGDTAGAYGVAGAEGVAAGFEEAAADSAASVPGAAPGGDDLAAALSALGALDDADVEVAVGESPETDRDTADLPTVGLDAFEALRALEGDEGPPAFAGTYGVAGKEAFEALREGDTDDLSDWDAFAGAGSAPSSPVPTAPTRPAPLELPAERPVVAEAAALDEPAGADGEPRHKRGIWPFRRRRRDEEAVAEEAADWDADGKPVPGTWFPEVDEDVVVPPTADLPEVECRARRRRPIPTSRFDLRRQLSTRIEPSRCRFSVHPGRRHRAAPTSLRRRGNRRCRGGPTSRRVSPRSRPRLRSAPLRRTIPTPTPTTSRPGAPGGSNSTTGLRSPRTVRPRTTRPRRPPFAATATSGRKRSTAIGTPLWRWRIPGCGSARTSTAAR